MKAMSDSWDAFLDSYRKAIERGDAYREFSNKIYKGLSKTKRETYLNEKEQLDKKWQE